jgi:hypothetical protein
MFRRAIGAILLTLPSLIACEPTQLYIAHNTVIGLDAAVSTEQTAGHLTIGYDRQFLALVPKSVPEAEGDAKSREAMAALVCSELKVDGIFLTAYNEKLATGDAAKRAAKVIASNPKRPSIFDCGEQQ